MSYKTSHSLFELICSKLFATMVLSGILLASTISGANSILAAPSHGSPTSTPLSYTVVDKIRGYVNTEVRYGVDRYMLISPLF
ncbi:MAG: hypothetical protein WBE34_11230 [Candidatus Nitrosopolaris sp.]